MHLEVQCTQASYHICPSAACHSNDVPLSVTSRKYSVKTVEWIESFFFAQMLLSAYGPLPSNRQHLSCGDCLEGKRGDYLTSFVLLCIIIVHIICTPI